LCVLMSLEVELFSVFAALSMNNSVFVLDSDA